MAAYRVKLSDALNPTAGWLARGRLVVKRSYGTRHPTRPEAEAAIAAYRAAHPVCRFRFTIVPVK